MTGINPCPYCGAGTRINNYSKRTGKVTPHVFRTAQIKCKRNSCGMSGPLFKGHDARRMASEHWNKCQFTETAVKVRWSAS